MGKTYEIDQDDSHTPHKDFESIGFTDRQLSWAIKLILGRTKTEPSNRHAYLKTSLERFSRNLGYESRLYLLDLARVGIQSNQDDLAEALKQTIAEHDLPTSPHELNDIIDEADALARASQSLSSSLNAGRGPRS